MDVEVPERSSYALTGIDELMPEVRERLAGATMSGFIRPSFVGPRPLASHSVPVAVLKPPTMIVFLAAFGTRTVPHA